MFWKPLSLNLRYILFICLSVSDRNSLLFAIFTITATFVVPNKMFLVYVGGNIFHAYSSFYDNKNTITSRFAGPLLNILRPLYTFYNHLINIVTVGSKFN